MVGLVRGVHALRGRLRVEVLTDRPEVRFRRGAILHPEGSDEVLTVVDARPVADGPGWWLRFRERRDRASAEPLRDAYLEADVPAEDLAAGEVWWHEVIGAPVVDTAGRSLGAVADVYRAGGAEVLVVRGGPLGELDVPNVSTIVSEFAPRQGRIVVDVEALAPEAPGAPRPRGRRTRRAAAAASGVEGVVGPDAGRAASPEDPAGAAAVRPDDGAIAAGSASDDARDVP